MSARIHILLLILAVLNGCSPASEGAPTPGSSASVSPAPQALPTPARTSAPAIAATAQATLAPSQTPAAPAPTVQATAAPAPSATPEPAAPLFSYPIGKPGQPLGDGFFIRHGDQVENTWYNPGYWHTGEDWYATAGDTAGALVYAIADGTVEYIGGNYPGRVVIVRHAGGLYSMYGHLDPQVSTKAGAQVTEQSIWDALTFALADHSELPREQIGRATTLLFGP